MCSSRKSPFCFANLPQNARFVEATPVAFLIVQFNPKVKHQLLSPQEVYVRMNVKIVGSKRTKVHKVVPFSNTYNLSVYSACTFAFNIRGVFNPETTLGIRTHDL